MFPDEDGFDRPLDELEIIQPMKNNRRTLWLLLFSQIMFLFSSLIDPPTTWLMILLRGILPLIVVIYIALILAGYIPSRKE
jgi:hypothetical protein